MRLELGPEAFDEVALAGASRRAVSAAEFCEHVLRDERTGGAVRLPPMHRRWHEILDGDPRVVLWSAVETAKALPLDTPIPVPGGWTTMGAVQVGDEVFDSRGLPCRVRACTAIMVGHRVYRVTFDDGAELLADEGHQWTVLGRPRHRARPPSAAHVGRGPACACGCGLGTTQNGSGWHRYVHGHHRRRWGENSPRVVTTREIIDGGLRRPCAARRRGGDRYAVHVWRMPLPGPVVHPERILPVHPYVLGAWLGDGDSKGPILTCGAADRFVLDRCRALEGGDCPVRADRRNPNVLRGNVGGWRDKGRNHDRGGLSHRLRALGVLGNKHVPPEYLASGVAQREELLAGLLDTDGTVSSSGQVTLTSVNYRLAVDALSLVRSLGFKATLRNRVAKVSGRVVGPCHQVSFTATRRVFRLPRKARCCGDRERAGRIAYRCVERVEEIPSVPVRCIAVDSPDATYLAGEGFVVTHNTSELSVGRLLWELGRDPTARCAVVSNTYAQAVKVVRTVGAYVEGSDALHEIFPGLRRGEPWSANAITVRRPTVARDPSLQACGVHGAIMGSRLERLVLDDILDWENTGSARVRRDLRGWFDATLLGRLTANARAWAVGTAFHPDDLLHDLTRPPSVWTGYRFPILREDGASAWPEPWPLERIAAKRVELGEAEFARQLMCRARSEEESRFRREWIDVCLARGDGVPLVPRLDVVPDGAQAFTGVDLGVRVDERSDRTAIFTLLLWPDRTRQVLWLERGRWSGPEIVRRIADAHERFQSVVYVENVAAQEFIVQFAREYGRVPVRPFATGRNKLHPDFGVEGLAVEFQAGMWAIPSVGGAPASRDLSDWIDELLDYDPDEHAGDALMASWMAREGARMASRAKEGGVGLRVIG